MRSFVSWEAEYDQRADCDCGQGKAANVENGPGAGGRLAVSARKAQCICGARLSIARYSWGMEKSGSGGAVPTWSAARTRDAALLRRMDRIVGLHASTTLRPSTVYDGSVVRLSERRKSMQATLRDEALFDDAHSLLSLMGHGLQALLHLLRTHADYIVSGDGDKFDAHRDFELVAGEGLRALAFIVCLEAPEEGGELVFSPESGSSATVPYEEGLLLLFPCNLTHAALPVRKGRKRILKFDVLSQAPLEWLVLPTATDVAGRALSGHRTHTAISSSLLHALDVFPAMQSFEETPVGHPISTNMLEPDELVTVMQFFEGAGVDDSRLPRLPELLDRLCCPEAGLTPEDLHSLAHGRCVVLPPHLSPLTFLGRAVPRLVFVACAHRLSSPAHGSRGEELIAFALTDMTGQAAVTGVQGRADRWELTSGLDMQEVYQAVLDAVAFSLEWEGAEPCAASPEKGPDDVEGGGEARSEQTSRDLGKAEECARVPLEPLELPVLGDPCVDALLATQPHERFVSKIREVEECNDGDTYTTVRYETTVVRRGFVLCPAGLCRPLAVT